MSKEVRIRINPKTCEIEYEINGVVGPSCTDLTDQLTQGDDILEQKHTDGYYIPLPVPEYIQESDESEE